MAAVMESIQDRLVERVAMLLAMETPQKQIAAACGLSEARISELANSDAVRARKAEIMAERIEEMETLNKGWDALEEEAVGCALEYMSTTKDPEYALRAARVANQAQRRGGHGVNPGINGGNTVNATINLSAIFVERLQNMKIGPTAIEEQGRRVDALPVAQAERVLQDDVQLSMADIFNDEDVG